MPTQSGSTPRTAVPVRLVSMWVAVGCETGGVVFVVVPTVGATEPGEELDDDAGGEESAASPPPPDPPQPVTTAAVAAAATASSTRVRLIPRTRANPGRWLALHPRDQLLDPLVDGTERVLAEHGALRLVVQLQV